MINLIVVVSEIGGYGYGFPYIFGPQSGFGQAEIDFIDWEFPTRWPSAWWRAVNAQVIQDAEEAHQIHAVGLDAYSGSTSEVNHWLEYINAPSAITWYQAHNASIVRGYIENARLALDENAYEIMLMNSVLERVLFAQALAENPIFGPIADPQYSAINVNLITDLDVLGLRFYPTEYPIVNQQDIGSLTRGYRVMDRNYILNLAVGNLGFSELEPLMSGYYPYPFLGLVP
jgi:hypothetical protein